MTIETIPGTRSIGERLARGELAFLVTLRELGGIDSDEAVKVAALYRKNRITKMDAGIGRVSVKHGAFLDRDVIRRAAGY